MPEYKTTNQWDYDDTDIDIVNVEDEQHRHMNTQSSHRKQSLEKKMHDLDGEREKQLFFGRLWMCNRSR